jgi:very-short-patch-repair endonuclease
VTGGQASSLERAFLFTWAAMGGPPLTAEYRFSPPRRWRLDFAHVPAAVAVELEGGVWSGGRHVRPAGFEADCQKYNAATAAGWAVFRLTRRSLEADPASALAPILALIMARCPAGGWTRHES